MSIFLYSFNKTSFPAYYYLYKMIKICTDRQLVEMYFYFTADTLKNESHNIIYFIANTIAYK